MISEFAKEKVFWTRKMNLKLVKFIESRPHMWNQNHPKYTSTQMKDQTYAVFAAKYGNQFTGRAVKDRWTNIRTTFAHHLRKIKALDQNEDYNVKWQLWDACQFLIKAGKEKIDDAENTTFDDNKDDYDADSNTEIQHSHNKRNGDYEDLTPPDSIHCDQVADKLLQVFKGVQNDVFGIHQTRNATTGKAVAKKLASLNSYDAGQLSRQIMDILLMYDENNPTNPNNIDTLH